MPRTAPRGFERGSRGYHRDSGGASSAAPEEVERDERSLSADARAHVGRAGPGEPDRDSLVGYAAIKYSAIVIIVLAILAFLAWYVIPKLGS